MLTATLQAAAPLLLRELARIESRPEWSLRDRAIAIGQMLDRIFVEATRQEQIVFSSLFARISYAGHKHQLPQEVLKNTHLFRWKLRRIREGRPAVETDVALGASVVRALLTEQADTDFHLLQEAEPLPLATSAVRSVVALEDCPEENYLIVQDEAVPGQMMRVQYQVPYRNAHFQPTIEIIRKVFGFPVKLKLLETEINDNGDYIPKAIVIEPDYLVDVSAIAECFKDTGQDPYSYLVRKFLPYENTDPILIGNIANFFLDTLLNSPDADWTETFRKTFQMSPFVYAPMSNTQVKGIYDKAQKHFIHLKQMAMPGGGLEKEQIERAFCFLEPTFFSDDYGIQGRLDLLYRDDAGRSAIVELKSGTPYKPNSYGISRSHFTQTLLYDLLVRSVFGDATDSAKYILYSGVDVQQLRFAPTVKAEQHEAIQVRNQLVAIERLLASIRPGDEHPSVLHRLKAANGKGFTVRDYARFEIAYSNLDALERKYFNAFTGFIAREQWQARVGDEGSDQALGHAALWRDDFESKNLNFSILSHLDIQENSADQPEPRIVFARTERTNPLANFRVGDIAVLYPLRDETDNILRHQIIKCTITELNKTQVVVQLRFRQHNLRPFEAVGQWCLEPDLMDSGFAAMYRGLFEWAETSAARRALMLGRTPPPDNNKQSGYHLLWGPPGTGKTSVQLRDMAADILANTDDNLLLLAYTNRAVDEICEALDSIGGNIRSLYIRLGGKFSSSARFREQLLSEKIAEATTRADLKTILEKHRIFVSTVASFSSNDSLLALKKFQRLIVDEASQILEPQIVGLLTRFDHFTLIGDHCQLPAVTTQRPEFTQVNDADLLDIGLTDLRDAYFQRMYLRCIEQGWHWAYSQLCHQGRMHLDIMDFPNRFFYNNTLQGLPPEIGGGWQSDVLPGSEEPLLQQRVVFLDIKPDNELSGQKTSPAEAAEIARIVLFFKELYQKNGREWHPDRTLGIITPWRAQIAQIRAALENVGLDPDEMTVDTVERYQGGARDIILISTCVHDAWQLQSLVNLNSAGVDRKLNVALTRARHHLIMLGNSDVLRQDPRYEAFIGKYEIIR